MKMSSDDDSSSFEFGEDDMDSPTTEIDFGGEPLDHSDFNSYQQQQRDRESFHGNQRISLGWSYNPGSVRAPAPIGTAAPLSKRRRSSKQECFIEKLYKMATCDTHSSVFGFSEDGTYIEIRNPAGLAQVLNQYFKHSNTSSFIRQLNNYGFKTMSSVSTGKNIQCFIHPQFKKGVPQDLVKITRKTARILKKCKREIIKDLQTGEAVCRKRVKELEQLNSRLEAEISRLERANAALVREISHRDQIQLSHPTLAPGLASNASSFSSSLAEAASNAGVAQACGSLVNTPSRALSPIAYPGFQGSTTQTGCVPDPLMYSGGSSTSSFRSMATRSSTSSTASSESGGSPRRQFSRQSLTADPPISLERYYFEPVIEMVSDYSEESPLFVDARSAQIGSMFSNGGDYGLRQGEDGLIGSQGAYERVENHLGESGMLLEDESDRNGDIDVSRAMNNVQLNQSRRNAQQQQPWSPA